MKEKPKIVFVKSEIDWISQEFRFLKEGDVFSFDKEQIFTASCDSYIIENDGTHAVLNVNKDMERFLQDRKKERESKFFI